MFWRSGFRLWSRYKRPKTYWRSCKKCISEIFREEKEEARIATDWSQINIAFTNRDAEKMKVVSSSNYQRVCDANGGIKRLEQIETENLR